MKIELSDNNFKELEKICLFLDILIDCEEYNKFDTELRSIEKFSKELSFKLDDDFKELKEQEKIKGAIEQKILGLNIINSLNDINCFKIIATSKYLRRLIKENERKLETKIVKILFKELTEILLQKIPRRSEDKSKSINRDNQFRIIFLNELSASSEGHLAIGHADVALEELLDLDEKWSQRDDRPKIKHPYELYALYNKGLTYLHDQKDPEKAIETFEQITSTFEESNTDGKTVDNNKMIERFAKEYPGIKENLRELFPIYFWFFYIPSKYLIAEAHGDSFSSFKLEKTVKDTLRIIRNQESKIVLKDIFSNEKGEDLTYIIKRYYQSKFAIQLIFSAIDKRDERVFNNNTDTCNWLENFKEVISEQLLTILKDSKPSFIKNQLNAAEALFFLEHARTVKTKEEKIKYISSSFKKCVDHLEESTGGTEWSDFACTFLEGTKYALSNKICFKDLSLGNPRKTIDNYYEVIFKQIIKPEWIPRKKDLVEEFLDCQENLLKQNDKQKYIQYQLELIHQILSEDSERKFKKKWPNCEKEKLAKNLNETIKKDVGDWWNDNKDKFNNGSGWKDRFEKTIQEMKNKLKNPIYKLPDDVGPVAEFIRENMNCDFYTKKLRLNTEQFYDHLIYRSCRPSLKSCYGLTILRRWQSFTPALSMGSEVGHKGGGYFVYKTNNNGEIEEGLVIDPGFDFLENFFEEGFSIRDITAILITHSHRDHASDLMSIVTLVHEMNERGKRVFKDGKWGEEKKLILLIAEGCHQYFAEQIRLKRSSFRDVIRMKHDNPTYSDKRLLKHFSVKATKANHYDQSDHDSVGFIIKDYSGNKLIGFTGDTRWYNKIEDNYKDCPVICMNMGGVVDIFKEGEIKLSDLCDKNNEEHINNIKKMLLRENHLYLPGFYLMAKKLSDRKQKLLILSELCEEMKGGLRTDLAKKISQVLRIPVLPEDIGLTVILSHGKKGYVLCKSCNSSKNPNGIVPVETNKDNAIVYLCREHYNQLKEGSILPKINEMELDTDELRKPLINKHGSFPKQLFRRWLR